MALTGAWFSAVYNFTNWVTSHRTNLSVAAFSWEQYIPFIPLFIIPYWSIDLFFMAAPLVVRTRQELKVFVHRVFFCVGIAGIGFLLFPLQLQFHRPRVDGLLGLLFQALDNLNNYWNLAPSLHIALRTLLWTVYMPRLRGVAARLCQVWFICIGLSTLLCWQHHIIDVFTGQLLGMAVIHTVKPTHPPLIRLARTDKHLVLAVRYWLASLLTVALSWLLWPTAFVLLWPALSFAIVGAAYGFARPDLLGKADGHIRGASRWLLFPYHLLATLWQRKYLRQQEKIWRAATDVSFGPHLAGSDVELIDAFSIIDLAAERSEAERLLTRSYCAVPWLDLTVPKSRELLEIGCLVESCRQAGGVHIHCTLGRGRSALAVAAWLIVTGRATSAAEAVAKVRLISPVAVLTEEVLVELAGLVTLIDKTPIAEDRP